MQRGGGGLGAALFTDIVDSTSIAAEMGNVRWSELVSRHHRIIRQLLARFGGREIDTAGDGFFATFDRPAAAIRCAAASVQAIRELGIEIRAGVSFGELELAEGKPSGLAVNTAARVMSAAGPGEVLVPASVRDILEGTPIFFADHGRRRLKGLPRDVRLFRVSEVDGVALGSPLDADESARRRGEIFPSGASRRTVLALGIALGAIAVVVGIALLATTDRPGREVGPPASLENAVARIDPDTGSVLATIPLDRQPTRFEFVQNPLAAGEGGVWVLSSTVVFHLDPLHADVRPSVIAVGFAGAQDMWAGLDAVWVVGGPGTVWRVNAATDEATPAFVNRNTTSGYEKDPYTLALGDAVWIGLYDGTLVRLDPRTGARKRTATGYSIDRLAVTTDHVWLVDIVAGALVPVDPVTLEVGDPIQIAGAVDRIEGEGDRLWVLERATGIVSRRDGETGEESGSARVGADATDMDVTDDAVWVGSVDGFIYHVDALTLEVRDIRIGAEVVGVAADRDGSVWTYVGGLTER